MDEKGSAELGFGDGDEATELPLANEAYFFRRSFLVDEVSGVRGVSGRLKRDDGAVVYVNGTEVVRSNTRTVQVT